jgi:hypothetical protein
MRGARPLLPKVKIAMRAFWLPISALISLAACTQVPPPQSAPVVVAEEVPKWRNLATSQDAQRLDRVDEAWTDAFMEARRFRRRIGAEGALLDPEAALPRPAPTPGSYLCRLIRLGSAEHDEPAFMSFKPFFCYVGVNGDQLSITKQTGTARPAGYLWEDEQPNRMIFLGSLAPGDEAPLAYGDDPTRDMAGLFERIAPFRYRLVIPYPQSGAKLEIFELVPAPVQAE